MRREDKQKKFEEEIYDAIEELADEFDLNVPFYPEVQVIFSDSRFNLTNFAKKYRPDFDSIKRGCSGASISNPPIILLRENCPAYLRREEAAHFLHSQNSNIKLSKQSQAEADKIQIMREMLGFFGSCYLGRRGNPFRIRPDLFVDYDVALEFTEDLADLGMDSGGIHVYWVHKQGYCLGQALFAEYSRGRISKERINYLFRESFEKKGKAEELFIKLREEVGWPFMK